MGALNILGKKCPLKYTKLEEDNGIFCPKKFDITLCSTLSKDEHDQTIIHELIHAVFDRILSSTQIHPMVEEIIADSIATAVQENFKIELR